MSVAELDAAIAARPRMPVEEARALPTPHDAPLVESIDGILGKAVDLRLPLQGQYPCAMRRDPVLQCKSTVPLPGVCPACATVRAREAWDKALESALVSIPDRFRWAVRGAAEAAERIHDWARVRVEMAAARTARIVVFVGNEPQRGKTSAACMLFHTTIMGGRFDALTEEQRETLRATFTAGDYRARAAIERLPEVVRARGAKFVAARSLRGRGPEVVRAREAAIAAPVLLLDDVGDELDGAPVGSGVVPDRVEGTREVVAERSVRRGLTTYYTTWLAPDAMASYHGGGTMERVYAPDACVIWIGPKE